MISSRKIGAKNNGEGARRSMSIFMKRALTSIEGGNFTRLKVPAGDQIMS